ncbi:MAG: hypothetical protein NTZ72_13715, partial [Afipia sp.]|nr:hypothetical protein [Afipia sp.]
MDTYEDQAIVGHPLMTNIGEWLMADGPGNALDVYSLNKAFKAATMTGECSHGRYTVRRNRQCATISTNFCELVLTTTIEMNAFAKTLDDLRDHFRNSDSSREIID